MKAVIFLMLFVFESVAFAGPMDSFVFDSPEQEDMFNKLSGELRCLVCQNQAISDSNAGLAQDLRKEIHGMILEGKTEDEIVTFMVDRYGDYILYRPPFKPVTWLLWFGPLIAFVVGLFYVVRFLRTQRTTEEVGELSSEEAERLRNLQSELDASEKKGNE
jgi:cytochrome c-type biogenesis protein CcmH